MPGEKVEKIPLRHESDYLALRLQPREIRDRDRMTIKYSANFAHYLMRQLKKFLE